MAGMTLGEFRHRYARAWARFVDAIALEAPTERCHRTRQLLGELEAGTAPAEVAHEIDAHCLDCASCRVFARESYRALELMPFVPVVGLAERWSQRIAIWWDRTGPEAAAAGGTAAAGAGFWAMIAGGGPSRRRQGRRDLLHRDRSDRRLCAGVVTVVRDLDDAARRPTAREARPRRAQAAAHADPDGGRRRTPTPTPYDRARADANAAPPRARPLARRSRSRSPAVDTSGETAIPASAPADGTEFEPSAPASQRPRAGDRRGRRGVRTMRARSFVVATAAIVDAGGLVASERAGRDFEVVACDAAPVREQLLGGAGHARRHGGLQRLPERHVDHEGPRRQDELPVSRELDRADGRGRPLDLLRPAGNGDRGDPGQRLLRAQEPAVQRRALERIADARRLPGAARPTPAARAWTRMTAQEYVPLPASSQHLHGGPLRLRPVPGRRRRTGTAGRASPGLPSRCSTRPRPAIGNSRGDLWTDGWIDGTRGVVFDTVGQHAASPACAPPSTASDGAGRRPRVQPDRRRGAQTCPERRSIVATDERPRGRRAHAVDRRVRPRRQSRLGSARRSSSTTPRRRARRTSRSRAATAGDTANSFDVRWTNPGRRRRRSSLPTTGSARSRRARRVCLGQRAGTDIVELKDVARAGGRRMAASALASRRGRQRARPDSASAAGPAPLRLRAARGRRSSRRIRRIRHASRSPRATPSRGSRAARSRFGDAGPTGGSAQPSSRSPTASARCSTTSTSRTASTTCARALGTHAGNERSADRRASGEPATLVAPAARQDPAAGRRQARSCA